MLPGPARTFARAFQRLARVAHRQAHVPAARARKLVLCAVPWESWRDAFNALHHADPQAEARVAQALARAARATRQPLWAARFTLLEGRGLLRFGLPGEAAEVLVRASTALRTVGERERAAQALVTAVDALAHAGRLREALRLAEGARRHLGGAKLAAWRDFLAINRANALRLIGDVAGARRDYEGAALRLARRGDAATATIARLNAGVARLEAGEPEPAHAVFVACAAAFEAQGRPDMAREAHYNAACADLRRGRLGAAVRALEALADAHDAQGPSRRGALCRMDLAEALLRAGDPRSSEQEAVRARAGFRLARAPAEEVEAWLLAAAAAARGDRTRAARMVRHAQARAQRLTRATLVDRCRLLAADLGARAGRPVAPQSLRALARRARRAGQLEIAAQALLLEAAGRLAAGRPARTLARLRELGSARGQTLQIAVAAVTLEAQAQAALGRRAPALRALERACTRLEPVALELPGGWLRAAFLLEHLDPWLARIELLLERGRPADRRAAELVLERLADRRFRVLGRAPPGDAHASRLRARLEALYDRLGRGGGPTRGAGVEETRALLAQAQTVERALAETWRRAERRAVSMGPEIRASAAEQPLAADQAVLYLWRGGEHAHALLRHGAEASPGHDLGPVSALVRVMDRLAFHARRLQLDRSAEAAFHAALATLAQPLLAPLAGAALPARLALVVDPALPDLPYEVLPWEGAPLASRTRLLRVPSVRARGPARVAGVGVAWLALGEPDLPGVAREAASLAPTTQLVEGCAATRAALQDALVRRARVHVAGHGFAAAEAPALGGVRLADGWFGAADLPERVHADLVVLAACRTGRVAGHGALAWGGLPAQLLAAGARHCVWTADDIDDATAAALTADLDRRLGPGGDVTQAFGGALEAVARERGNVATLLPLRLSGLLG